MIRCEVTVRFGDTKIMERVDAERTVDALMQVLQQAAVQKLLQIGRYGGISTHVAPVDDLRAVAVMTDAPKPWEAAA